MHFHSRCNVNFICGSIMSLHIKFRCGLRSPDKQQIDIFVVFFELLMHSLKSKQTMFSQTDPMETGQTHEVPSSANGRGDTSPQIQVTNPNRGRFVLISKKFKT